MTEAYSVGNYIEYLKWLGGHDLSEHPFNEADVMILCQLSYLDMSDVMEPDSEMTLRECCGRLEEGKGLFVRMLSDSEIYREFFRLAAASERFGTLVMSGFTDIFSHEEDVQFSAVTFELPDDRRFIAYRGTDDSITGWKEDFMLSFTRTRAQQLALEYAQKVIGDGSKKVVIAGHSKGGNLALYASAMLSDEMLTAVEHIYSLDGPGFCSDVIEPGRLERIRDKTTVMCPEYSVVGKLFEPDIPDTRVVCSDGEGVMQHDIHTWRIEYGLPKYAEKNSYRSVWLNGVIDKWIEQLPPAEREVFVNELLEALAKDGIRTFTDIAGKGPFGLEKTLMNMTQVSDSFKKDALELPMQMIYGDTAKEIKKFRPQEWIKKHGILNYIALIVLGVCIAAAPKNIVNVLIVLVFAGATAFQTAVTIHNLRESKWNAEREQPRIYICIAMITALIAVLIKENALFVIGTMALGVAFLIEAFRRGRCFKNTHGDIFEKIMSGTETMFCFIFGMSYLIIPQSTIMFYALSAGGALIIDGALRFGNEIYKMIRKSLLR